LIAFIASSAEDLSFNSIRAASNDSSCVFSEDSSAFEIICMYKFGLFKKNLQQDKSLRVRPSQEVALCDAYANRF